MNINKSIIIGYLDNNYPYFGLHYRANDIPAEFLSLKLEELNNKKFMDLVAKYFPYIINNNPVDYKVCRLALELNKNNIIPDNLNKRLDLKKINLVNLDRFLFYNLINTTLDEASWLTEVKRLPIEDQKFLMRQMYIKWPKLSDLIVEDKELYQAISDFTHQVRDFEKKVQDSKPVRKVSK